MLKQNSWAAAALTLCALCMPSAARAGGYAQSRFGSELGHAATPTPFAVYYNPAALAATRRVHLAVDLTLAMHSQNYKRTAATVPEPSDAQGANIGTAK